MDRRDRNRYDRNDYGPDYSTYDRDDRHYHHARNLTNEFEQEYRSHHPEMDRDRYDRDRYNRDRGSMRHSYHEGNMGDAYERMREDRDSRHSSRSRNQGWGDSGNSGRYNQRYNEYNPDRNRDMYNRDRYSNQDRGGRMSQDNMRQSSDRSNRGMPNAGISSSFSDDYGTDFDRDRSYGISSGNYGGYGSHSGDYRRNRGDW